MLCVPWTRRVCSVWLQRAAEPTTDQDCVRLSSTPKSLTDILTGHAADRSQARTWGAVSSVQTGPPETQYMQPTGYQQKKQSRAQRALDKPRFRRFRGRRRRRGQKFSTPTYTLMRRCAAAAAPAKARSFTETGQRVPPALCRQPLPALQAAKVQRKWGLPIREQPWHST